MGQLFVNNLTLTLSEDVVTNQPTLSVVSSTGLPTFQLGDWLYLTLTDIREGGELRWEIVKVTSWTGTTLTVVRGQDGTAAQAWLAGAKASLRVTAADIAELEAAVTPAQLLTAIKTVDGSGSGLDADLLDGIDSSGFVKKDEADVFLTRLHANGTANDYSGASVELRGNGVENTVKPVLGFHQPGLFAGTLEQLNDTNFQFKRQDGSPATLLNTVSNADLLDGIGSSGFAKVGGNSGALTIGTNDASALALKTNNTARVTVSADGDVGIGGATTTNGLIVGNLGGTNGYISLRRASDGVQVGSLSADTTNSKIDLQSGYGTLSLSTSSIERMRIASSGNVGVGTSSPSAKLHVVSADSGSGTYIRAHNNFDNVAPGHTAGITLKTGVGESDGMQWDICSVAQVAYGGAPSLIFKCAASDYTTPTEKMRITSTGNFLINTTTDNGVDKLQVNGSSYLHVYPKHGVIPNTISGDLNDFKTGGVYGVYILTNTPISDHGYLEVFTYSADWVMQRFTSLGVTGSAGRTFVRCFTFGTTWTAWVEK